MESPESESSEEEAVHIGREDSDDGGEPETGSSGMHRSNECGKRGNPTMSTPSSETRPSSTRTPKRRQLFRVNSLQLYDVSPILEPLRSVSPGFRSNSPNRPDSPDYRPDSP